MIHKNMNGTTPHNSDNKNHLSPIWHNSCGAPIVNKQVAYGYDDGFLTHQPRVVYDTVASESYNLY